jgi:hypothetical protein
MKRTTYSRKTMTMVPDENGDGRKRRKADSRPDDIRPRSAREDLSGPSAHPKSKSHAKKPSGAFDYEDENMEDELAPLLCDSLDWKTKKKPSAPSNALDKWTQKDLPRPKKVQNTIYGEESDYNKYMVTKLKKKEHMKRLELERNRPALANRKRNSIVGQTSKDFSCSQGGLIHHQDISVAAVNAPAGKSRGNATSKQTTNSLISIEHEDSETSKMFAQNTKPTSIRRPYVQKQHIAAPTSAPFKNICQRRIRGDSREAKLWSQNQSDSLLLCLPGELRNRIYDLVLGGKTICIESKTWQKVEKNGHITLVPHFKYHYKIMNAKTNPWAPYLTKAIQRSEGLSGTFTLLNGVCRQFYEETAVLPYKLNRWAFANYLTMWNFLMVERRLTRAQREAIEELVVSDHLPQQNLLGLLTGLKKALLASPLTDGDRGIKGWYSVEESREGRKLVKIRKEAASGGRRMKVA